MDPWEKSQTIDPEVRAYVQSLVNAVGGRSTYDETYSVGDDAQAALNDLVRWMRLYDEKLHRWDVRRCLAEANLLQGDLIEILALWPEDQTEHKVKSKLALSCLQLMVPLTWPLQHEKDTEQFTLNNARHYPFLQLAEVGYKRAILGVEQAKILRTVVRIALPAMAEPRRDRTRRSTGIIKMMLYLFRNIAGITQPQHLPSQGDENDISRSATIEAFADQDIFNLLLTMGSGVGDEFIEEDVIILEILFHLLKGVDPKKLFMEKQEVETEETNELQSLMRKEKAMVNGYKKHAPTRHNRFGTMIWVQRDNEKRSTLTGQNSITDESTVLQQMDSNKKWDKPKYRGKLTKEFNENSDFGMRVDLTENARKCLRNFVEDFLDSSFNPLFSSVRKAMERSNERVQDSLHNRQFFYLVSWFLSAERARKDQSHTASLWNANRTVQTGLEDNTFTYIAAVLDQETFVLLNRHMQRAFDGKEWQNLQSTLLCFTQILLTVQAMAESKDEEDQEIADNIMSRIFYEETTHDRIVQILRGYTHQGFAYLDTITECVHIFVRMLERYSKENVDLMIRSKRRTRRKKQKENPAEAVDAEDAEDEAEDTREAHIAVSERKFDFARFSAKFLSQGCVDSFVALLHFYKDLTASQLKRCHRYFYRLAFKHELAVFLFRVDILQLFHKIVKGPEGLSPELEGFSEWQQLVQAVFRKCIKWVDRSSEGEGWKEVAMIEMLFSKVPNTLFYLQNGYERVVEKRAPRPPAELQIKSSVAEDQRIGVAIGLMIDKSKADAIGWVRKELQRAIEERAAWEESQSALAEVEQEGVDDALEPRLPPSIFLNPDNEERKLDTFKDKHLRLLLTTLGLTRLGLTEDVDASWIVPPELASAQLQEALEAINKAEFNPPTFDDNKSAEDMTRNKSSASRNANTYSDDESDGEGSGADIDEAMFPPNLREARKEGVSKPKHKRLVPRNRKELTEEEIDERAAERRKREQERNSKIKSALYITAEDDMTDDEADEEFFRLEEVRRLAQAGQIRDQMSLVKDAEGGNKKKKTKKRKAGEEQDGSNKKRRSSAPVDDDEDSGVVSDASSGSSDSNSSSDHPRVLDDSDIEPTPSTSPQHIADDTGPISTALREKSANIVSSMPDNGPGDDDDDEDDGPVLAKPNLARRNIRAGFVIDDSDDE